MAFSHYSDPSDRDDDRHDWRAARRARDGWRWEHVQHEGARRIAIYQGARVVVMLGADEADLARQICDWRNRNGA